MHYKRFFYGLGGFTSSEFIRKSIAQITLETSNSRRDCLEMPIKELVEYYFDLADELEARNKSK